MRIALICIPALMLSSCAMLQTTEEPVAYQAPAVVAKPAPVVKKVAVAPKRVVRKPVVAAQPSSERSERDGAESPW